MTQEQIAAALRESTRKAGWSPVRVAVEVGKGEQSARKWLNGTTEIGGPDLLRLMRALPDLRKRLLGDEITA